MAEETSKSPQRGRDTHASPKIETHGRTGSPSGAAPVYRSPTSEQPEASLGSQTSLIDPKAREMFKEDLGQPLDFPLGGAVRRASISDKMGGSSGYTDSSYVPMDENAGYSRYVVGRSDPGLTMGTPKPRSASMGAMKGSSEAEQVRSPINKTSPTSPSSRIPKTFDEVMKEREERERQKMEEAEKPAGLSAEGAATRHHAESGGPHLG